MSTLNSVEISDELIRLGFALTVNNQHANGYEHSCLSERVFVKMSKTGAPVGKQPLLIRPEYAASSHWEAITALSPSQPNTGYRNTNMSGFPRLAGSDSQLAIALDIATQSDLHQLLELLGLRTPGSSQEPDINELSGLDLKDLSLTDTEREALIKARIGQGGYREALLTYWGGCAITDCTVPVLLRASHIKPWREASARERLDPYNGLLLTPNLDLAFDQGLISFNDHGRILISENLDPESAQALNITPELRLRRVEPPHRAYLAWHREYLFRK